MSFICVLEVDGKPCGLKFNSRRKLKEHLAPAPHHALRVVCPFCTDREVTFNRAADLKIHVLKRHKDAVASANVPADELLSENNCFWLSYHPEHYRFLVEPTDRNTRASSRLRSLLLEWTRKILASSAGPKVRKTRSAWLEGWESAATDFRAPSGPSVDQHAVYSPSSPGIFTPLTINLIPGEIQAVLEDADVFFKVGLDDKVLFDPKSVASLTRKMAVQKRHLDLQEAQFSQLEEGQWRRQAPHFATSLGIEPDYLKAVWRAVKPKLPEEPEIELFAESDLESSPSPSTGRKVVERTPPHVTIDPEPAKKKLKLVEASIPRLPVKLPLPPPVTTVLPPLDSIQVTSLAKTLSASATPLTSILATAPTTPLASIPLATPTTPSGPLPVLAVSMDCQPSSLSPVPTLGPLATRAQSLLARGCMPLLPPARRQWDREEAVVLASGSVSMPWPPKGFKSMSPDKKLMELEFAALSLRRSQPGGCNIERPSLLDEFNFMALPGTPTLSPKKLSAPHLKSRVYLYKHLRNIATGHSTGEEDEEVVEFLESGSSRRKRRWDDFIRIIDQAGIPLRLND